MNYVGTRGGAAASLSEAVRHGAAPDGGLYMPAVLPALDPAQFDAQAPLAEFAPRLLEPFFAGDRLAPKLSAICAEAFDFPMPLVTPDPARPGLRALELFHGPTLAFKDIALHSLFRAGGPVAATASARMNSSPCARRAMQISPRPGCSIRRSR